MTEPRSGLADALAATLSARDVTGLHRMSGGAWGSRVTWGFEADGQPLVLQRGRRGEVGGASMATEARVLRAAQAAGVPVPMVVRTDADHRTEAGNGQHDPSAELGSSWMIVERIAGETSPGRILRDRRFAGARAQLAAECGRALAATHAIDPGDMADLEANYLSNRNLLLRQLHVEPHQIIEAHADDAVDQLRSWLDMVDEPRPAFELGFRWLARNRPPIRHDTVVHGDFRTGNLIVTPDGLQAVIDWELTHLGDPLEDLASLCVRAWRFGATPPVGGFGQLDDLVGAYENACGHLIDRQALAWWQTMGTLRWGVVCMIVATTRPSRNLHLLERMTHGVDQAEHDLLSLLP